MRTQALLLSIFVPTIMLPLVSGCFLIHAPEPQPAWPVVPQPTGIVFDPAAGVSHGTPLNKAGDATLPEAFRASLVLSGESLVLQSVKTVGGKKVLGPPDTSNPVHITGIVVPRAGQTGYEEAKRTVTAWTKNQDLDVEIDTKYPTDENGVRQVQIFFKGTGGKTVGQPLSLNRMMIRSGYAIVDLNSPTSFDQKQWLYDESYARKRNAGLWGTGIFRTLQQRLPDGTIRRLTPKSAAGNSAVTITSAAGATTAGAPATGDPAAAAAAGAPIPAPTTQ